MKEIWKDLPGYEGLYQVSNLGKVKSLNYHRSGRNKIMKGIKEGHGYLYLNLCKNGERKREYIHRLVLSTFYPVINMNELEVNHINEIKSDNKLDNLEWCDRAYNNNYGNRKIKALKAISIPIKCLTTGKEFNSIADGARFYKISKGNLSLHLSGKIKSCGKINGKKMHWEYIK